MTQLETVLAQAEASDDQAIARWMDWLRIPSVSAQPAHAADCRAAAEFARAELAAMGFQATIRETAGQPVVLAHHAGPGEDAPHLLYYGHYDVQPPEPLALWTNPPFEPVVVDGPNGPRMVARGATDDKGQVAMWLGAFRAWFDATGSMPVRITVLIEGEEEIGSPNLEPFVASNAAELEADIVVISDTGMWDVRTPALTTSLRGMVYMQVDLRGPVRDLHSGSFGGSALNPINALTQALGGLHDAAGHIQIPGFYDGIADIAPSLAAQWDSLGFDEGASLREIGLTTPVGETDRTALERLWARPTADINGIWGGYQGEGSKTVIASESGAKVSFRLVPGQDPQAIAAGFAAFMRARLPADIQASFTVLGSAPGIEIATDSIFVAAAQAAMSEEYRTPSVLIGCGGSIPIVESFRRMLGIDSLLMGFALADCQAHSPDENFDLVCFRGGLRSHVRLLGKLGAQDAA
jgi:acetylornithine deacetylase/succinyl-diaminopimelate desuccinylase-like protein